MPAGIIGRRASRNRNNRRGVGTRNLAKPTPIGVVSSDWDDNELTIVFNQPVSLKGVPQYPGTLGLLPTAAELLAPNTLKLTYPDAGKGAPNVTVPSEEPAVRNSSGGYVSPQHLSRLTRSRRRSRSWAWPTSTSPARRASST